MKVLFGADRVVTKVNKFSGVQRGLGACLEVVTLFKTPTLILFTSEPTGRTGSVATAKQQ